tara:strand:+ start:242 stop:502 length:261 start_codon:yes stop_codon:yes gene_type:complete
MKQEGNKPNLDERDYQKSSERIKGHKKAKSNILDKGLQDNTEPYEEDPPKERSKSAPPGGAAVGESKTWREKWEQFLKEQEKKNEN